MDDRTVPTQFTIRLADNPAQYTSIIYEKLLYDREIPDSIFDQTALRRNSQQGKNLNQGWLWLAIS